MKTDKQFFQKRLLFLTLPMICQELVGALVNMVDTFMIGRLGLHEVTSVGLANQVFFIFMLMIFGVTSGSQIFMSQYWGKQDIPSIHKTMGINYASGVVVAFVFAIAAFIFPEFVMKLYSNNDQKVIELGSSYLRVICFSYVITAIVVCTNVALKSTGQTRLPMVTTIIALLCNVTLNYVFIFKLNMSVAGAAYATLISRIVELVLQIVLVRVIRSPILAPHFKAYMTADWAFAKRFYAIALPVILNETTWAVGTTLYQVAYKFTGTEGQGAVQIAGTIQNLFSVVGFSVGTGCGIIIANTLGAGEKEKAVYFARLSIKYVLVFSTVMCAMLISASPFLISLFNVTQDVKDSTFKIMIVISVSMIIKTLNYTTIVGILRSGGDTVFCLTLDLATVWLVGIPLSFIGGALLHLPIYWVVLLSQSEEISKCLFALKRVKSNVWVRNLVENG